MSNNTRRDFIKQEAR